MTPEYQLERAKCRIDHLEAQIKEQQRVMELMKGVLMYFGNPDFDPDIAFDKREQVLAEYNKMKG